MADGSPKTTPRNDLRASFPGLYREHAGMVRRALRQLGVPPGSLDDAVQDVFVVLHRRIDDFERDRSLTNWLWGIARGVASGYRRSARRRDRLQAALPAPESPALPERGVARQQAAEILDDFLGSLDADKCAVFVLSEIEGRRGPEIAELLDVNVNTVYARLRAARQRFDRAMDRHRTEDRRPMFAAWLSFSWPGWLSKPAVAMGASALAVVAVAQSTPTVAADSNAPVVAMAETAGDELDEPTHRWPRSVAPRVKHRPVSAPPEEHDEVMEIFEEETQTAPTRTRTRRPMSVTPVADAIEPDEVLAELEPEAGLPPQAPWSTTVHGQPERQPVRHPSLVELRHDFVAELWRIAIRL